MLRCQGKVFFVFCGGVGIFFVYVVYRTNASLAIYSNRFGMAVVNVDGCFVFIDDTCSSGEDFGKLRAC